MMEISINGIKTNYQVFGEGKPLKSFFRLVDHRPGYLMQANVTLPAPGTYTYRIAAKILDKSLMREGIYLA